MHYVLCINKRNVLYISMRNRKCLCNELEKFCSVKLTWMKKVNLIKIRRKKTKRT